MGNILPLLLDDDGALLHLEGPLDRGGEWHPVQAVSGSKTSFCTYIAAI